MSVKMYQELIQKTKETTDRIIGFVDETYTVVACSDFSMIGQVVDANLSEFFALTDTAILNGFTYRMVGSRIRYDGFVFVKGTDSLAETLSGGRKLGKPTHFEEQKGKF